MFSYSEKWKTKLTDILDAWTPQNVKDRRLVLVYKPCAKQTFLISVSKIESEWKKLLSCHSDEQLIYQIRWSFHKDIQ